MLHWFQVGLDQAEESGSPSDEDSKTKFLVLDVIRKAVKLSKAAFDLVNADLIFSKL